MALHPRNFNLSLFAVEVFGLEHRPIVEFAIENMKILEKRAKREAARRLAHDSRKAEQKVGRSEEISINLDCAPKQMDSKAKVTVGQQLGTVGDEVEADEELLLQRKKSKKTSTFTVGKKRKQAPEATSVPEHLETRGSRKADEASGNEMRSRSRKKKVHVTASGEGRTAMKVKKQEVGGRQIKRPRLQVSHSLSLQWLLQSLNIHRTPMPGRHCCCCN